MSDPVTLPRWLLPFAWCFAIGVWLVVALVIAAPHATFARWAEQAVAWWSVPRQVVVLQEPRQIVEWDEPYVQPVVLIPPLPKNCKEARAWGLAPAYVGNPGYAPWLDGDHDGISCEPLPRRLRYYSR